MENINEIQIYTTTNSNQPFTEWLNKLNDKIIRARIRRRIDRLSLGHYGDIKSIGDGIYELRLHFGSGYRIYLAKNHIAIILLCGGDKSTQTGNIEKAKHCLKDFIERTHI